MKNIEFNYLYRDAYNYKNFNSVIFAPSLKIEFIDELHDAINLLTEKEDFIILKKLEKEIKNILDTDENFIINYEIDVKKITKSFVFISVVVMQKLWEFEQIEKDIQFSSLFIFFTKK